MQAGKKIIAGKLALPLLMVCSRKLHNSDNMLHNSQVGNGGTYINQYMQMACLRQLQLIQISKCRIKYCIAANVNAVLKILDRLLQAVYRKNHYRLKV